MLPLSGFREESEGRGGPEALIRSRHPSSESTSRFATRFVAVRSEPGQPRQTADGPTDGIRMRIGSPTQAYGDGMSLKEPRFTSGEIEPTVAPFVQLMWCA